jgi:hypothetical protein
VVTKKRRVPGLEDGHPGGLAANGGVAVEFGCGGTPGDGGSGPTARESGEMSVYLSPGGQPRRVQWCFFAATATLAVACLAAFPAWAERNAATPNPDLGASVSEPPRPGSAVPDEAARTRVAASYGKLPMSFEANRGQTDAQVDFLSRGSNYSLFLTSTAAVAVLRKGTSGISSVLRMELLGGNPTPPVEGQEALAGKSNYFIGNDPAQWHADIPTFGRVKYGNVWPGIDLAYHGRERQLEYDFIVAPHASPNAIKLGFQGARKLRVDRNGDLVLRLVALHRDYDSLAVSG